MVLSVPNLARLPASPTAPSAPRPSHAPPPARGAAPRGRSRRALLAGLGLGLGLRRAARAESALSEEQKLQILQEVQSMGDIAVTAPTVQEEEAAWTRMLDRFAGLPDIEVRVRCNRGNSLARQGKLQATAERIGASRWRRCRTTTAQSSWCRMQRTLT
ncbi:unnamed protein product [Effrenium voratum]|uniref:Uncharacterized protein n=1 Tax=Effrenium voratum TaxID=2562239 RepID=A0AA36HMZ5_9DINO|nr:unnamed protein product [Effrenium voratum]